MKNQKEDRSQTQLESVLSESNIAFSDANVLKSSVSTEEFEAVIEMLTKVHSDIAEQMVDRQKAKDLAKERLINMRDQGIPDVLFSNAVKTTKALITKADEVMRQRFKTEYKTINHITDFLNIFRDPKDQLDYVNVDFKNNFKKE